MTPAGQQRLALVSLLCMVASIGAALVQSAHGADHSPGTQLVLAQAAVAECGWGDANCHAAGWHVLARRVSLSRNRRTLAETARAYCATWKPINRLRKPWVRALVAPGEIAPEPSQWPAASASWARHAPKWRAVYERAGAFLRGEVRDPCKGGKALHFGGDMDPPGPGWAELQCEQTVRQHFYAFEGMK